jgi:hypothetical protein
MEGIAHGLVIFVLLRDLALDFVSKPNGAFLAIVETLSETSGKAGGLK